MHSKAMRAGPTTGLLFDSQYRPIHETSYNINIM